MPEFLHPAQTDPTPEHDREAHDPASATVLSMSHAPTVLQVVEAQAGPQEHHSAPFDDDLSAQELAALPTRHLRVLVNQAYKLMDTDYPPAGTVDRYEMIVEELECRVQQAQTRQPVRQLKETFRDNPLYRRFELFIDGELAAYLRYTMNGGQLVLVDSVEQPGFRDQGIDVTLMRNVVLNAHKRRLSVVPQCPAAFSFLADHPQYRVLTARLTR